jgi:hypothetical protein
METQIEFSDLCGVYTGSLSADASAVRRSARQIDCRIVCWTIGSFLGHTKNSPSAVRPTVGGLLDDRPMANVSDGRQQSLHGQLSKPVRALFTWGDRPGLFEKLTILDFS